jgi:hypothetical protein
MNNRYCPLCSNDPAEPRIRCQVLDQPICSNCSDILRNTFSQPIVVGPENVSNEILGRLEDLVGLSLAECAAIWLLKEIDRLSEEFRDWYEFNEYARQSWSRPMINELIWRLDEIDALSGLLGHPFVKDTPQAKHHTI